jgi:hypothetical protein
MDRFLPPGEFRLGNHDNIAFAPLARDDNRRAGIDCLIQVARQILPQIRVGDMGHEQLAFDLKLTYRFMYVK